jgi:hypothetical protein
MSYSPLGSGDQPSDFPTTYNENLRKARNLNLFEKTASFDVWDDDSSGSPLDTYHCDATSGAVLGTLPPAAEADVGRVVYMRKTDAGGNAVGFTADGSETINGSTSDYTQTTQHVAVAVYSDGTEWFGFKLTV